MAAKVWYVAAGKKKAGPMTSDRLRRQLSVGKLPKGALAWRDGMEAWEPVVEIDHLQPREADGGAEAQGSASSVEVAVPAQRTATPKQRSTARSTPSGAGKASRSGSRKGLKGTSGSRKARTAKAATGAATVEAGAFKPNFRFERKDMWQAFGLGLELGRVKLALAGMLLPAGASAVLGGVALVAAKLHVLLALPVLLVAGVASYVLTMVAVGALSYHAKHQLLDLERPSVKEALQHAMANAAPLSVPPFLLSIAWIAPLIALAVLALLIKIPYLGPVGTGLLFGVHIALGALTVFLMLAAGVAGAFGPVAAAFEETSVKSTLSVVLAFAKRSMVRTTFWGFWPSLACVPFAGVLTLVALAVLALPLAAVFASVGPETIEWLQAGGVGDAPYPGCMLMLIFMGLWIGFVGVVLSAILASVNNALLSLLYVGGREGNDSQISRDTYLARRAEGAL